MSNRRSCKAICTFRRAFAATAVLLSVVATTVPASAASGAVGVSITFEAAPADLLRAARVSPASAQACARQQRRIDGLWRTGERRPTLHCGSTHSLPLIVTSRAGGALIARP